MGRPCFLAMRTNFYIDAFNLYYGCVKGTACKWLNLEALCQPSFPDDLVHRIRYFTARVKARPGDPQQPIRQATYLRALGTLPCVSIHYGHYLQPVMMPYATPPAVGPATVRVLKSEEKGSDVNLATLLLVDAFDGDFEQAVVVSNDSDLALPIELVQTKFGLPVVVLFPCGGGRKPSYHLSKVAAASPIISTANLAASQFPATLTDAVGPFHKPATW
jgi:NYN domain